MSMPLSGEWFSWVGVTATLYLRPWHGSDFWEESFCPFVAAAVVETESQTVAQANHEL